ncbi:hypothetical protein BDV10DRAFT_168940 [Aspergillus recurvatus]
MRLNYIHTATLVLALTSSVLASTDGISSANTAIEARVVITATWKEYELPSANPNIWVDHETGDYLHAQKRKVVANPYTVPYPLQTGPTRYAPLAEKPGTAIATTSPTPQFPASPYKIATKYLKPGTVLTTLSATETLSVKMMENTVCGYVMRSAIFSLTFCCGRLNQADG